MALDEAVSVPLFEGRELAAGFRFGLVPDGTIPERPPFFAGLVENEGVIIGVVDVPFAELGQGLVHVCFCHLRSRRGNETYEKPRKRQTQKAREFLPSLISFPLY
nr:hypothetical protein Iba_chr05aCG17530 [Ipomoea batatas]GME02116.1 hypothetical protein Iba_contig3824CG0010 [Ipomoea batatas]